MLLEDQRYAHEDVEQLEQAISERLMEEPRSKRERLNRDHEIASYLDKTQNQLARLLALYNDGSGLLDDEILSLKVNTSFDEYYKRVGEIKEHHRKYPNEPVENLTLMYKRRQQNEGENVISSRVDRMFAGEEAFGRYFDMNGLHEQSLNLPGARHPSYIQYLDQFDRFQPPVCTVKRQDKVKEQYFKYVTDLAGYLESYMRKTRPLENLDRLYDTWRKDFDVEWEADKVVGWEKTAVDNSQTGAGTGENIWCADCSKGFSNENVFKSHLSGKKHIKNAEQRKANGQTNGTNGQHVTSIIDTQRIKERAVAEREFFVAKLAAAMKTERSDTRAWVERKQGMTDREREQELEALYAEADTAAVLSREQDDDNDEDDKIYNPLKLPLAWDGKPIPYWLYKLHGLGVEHSCEICGNYVYMGRRAFEKHFTEGRHVYGLKCLGITQTSLFREITSIAEAEKLWAKIQNDKKKEKSETDNIVQMEDSEGNVMPEKVYYDLQKQGLI